jgi:tetratricopeptide (TPR) repeat protein
MTRYLLTGLLLLFILPAYSQETASADSIKAALAAAKTIEEKFPLLKDLSRIMMNIDPHEADEYGKKLIELAEESRDRKYIITAYLENGKRCGFFAGRKEYFNRAVDYFNKGLTIARENKMDEERGAALLALSSIYLQAPDVETSLKYVSEAFSILSVLKNDSLKVLAHTGYGNVYLAKNEKIMALRYYLQALQKAEDIKNHTLMRDSYQALARFYNNISAYDKAIDNAMLAYKELDKLTDRSVRYQRVIDMSTLGRYYSFKKNYEMAIYYYERSIHMADSLKYTTLKMPAYVSLLNLYLQMDQPQKALAYMNSQPGRNLQQYMNTFGFSKVVDQVFAVVYTETGQYDSARNRFAVASPFFEQGTNENNKMSFYYQLATLYKKTGEHVKSIDYYLKAKDIALSTGSLETARDISQQLDSMYAKTGDYEMSYKYNSIYYQYKDSVEKMNKEKDVAQVEAADEQQRLERARKEEEERIRRKNNIQYMGITIGIGAIFILLVVFGMFRVSATTIKFIGFFGFLMFFEFIFLIFKKNIYSITHGEPWKDLAFMIALAAMLVPLHHWMEEKVIHYLTSHNRLTAAGKHIKHRFFSKKTGEA